MQELSVINFLLLGTQNTPFRSWYYLCEVYHQTYYCHKPSNNYEKVCKLIEINVNTVFSLIHFIHYRCN